MGSEVGQFLNELFFVQRVLSQADIDAYNFAQGFLGSTSLTNSIAWTTLYPNMY